jgi:serine phosphatase RsbU (regulator of sigma subunit)
VDIARSRERFLTDGLAEGAVRNLVLSSWQRCRSEGLRPELIDVPFREGPAADDGLVHAAGPVLHRLGELISGTPATVILTDAQGWILERRVGEPGLARQYDSVHGFPGFCLAEPLAGTNAINLALLLRRPCRLFGPEHYDERLQTVDCLAVPVRSPFSGRVLGALNIAYPERAVDRTTQAVMGRAVHDIEERLQEQGSQQERALLRTYLEDAGPAGLPGLLLPADTAGLEALLGTTVSRRDGRCLQETAAGLIAAGRPATVEVPLDDGATATLQARPVADAGDGVVVEVLRAQPPPWEPLEPPRLPRTPPATEQGGPPRRGLPLMIGEPSVGRFAVAARRRLELLTAAGARIGTTLEVGRTAEELAEATVPAFADFATVDLYDPVLRGDEPAAARTLRRAALRDVRGAGGPAPAPAGTEVTFAPGMPQARCLAEGRPVLEPDPGAATGRTPHTEGATAGRTRHTEGAATGRPSRTEDAARLPARQGRCQVAVPIRARGAVLGVAGFHRTEGRAAFEDDDVGLAEELVARAAVCLDNARRYTRERTLALALQQSLLPAGLPEQRALEVAHCYLPAHAGVGGDWFDVIPLSGARVALVIGDVVGHGIHAAVTMGRLRTAVQNFSAFDLAPEELLTHLDALVESMDRELPDGDGVIGATCLCAIYDPTTSRCTVARAGHLPPALASPDGTVTFPDLPAGPPLGLGGMPFESAEFDLPEGSRLVLYTDGLVEDRSCGIDTGLERLRHALAAGGSPRETCRAITGSLPTDRPCDDDVTVLVVRAHGVRPDDIASWEQIPAEPAVVPALRAAVTRQLAAWHLDDAAFTTELILSELLSNAVRHAAGPLQVRLIRDLNLICEVADQSSTAPHLRRAAVTDEGGRGLFLVAQLAERWGTRYTPSGKIIWAEQPIRDGEDQRDRQDYRE